MVIQAAILEIWFGQIESGRTKEQIDCATFSQSYHWCMYDMQSAGILSAF